MSLDLNTINQLLNEKSKTKTATKAESKSDFTKGLVQLGPLRFSDKEMTCASRGCRSSTFVKVNGIPNCMIHAAYELNKLLIAEFDVDDCNCKTGTHTKMHSHTADCPVWERYKESR